MVLAAMMKQALELCWMTSISQTVRSRGAASVILREYVTIEFEDPTAACGGNDQALELCEMTNVSRMVK